MPLFFYSVYGKSDECIVVNWGTALIRNNKPGITGFRIANGYSGLKDALEADSVRFQR